MNNTDDIINNFFSNYNIISKGNFGTIIDLNGGIVCKLEHIRKTSNIERKIYNKICNEDLINAWKKNKKILHLGIPKLLYSSIINIDNNNISCIFTLNYGITLYSIDNILSILDYIKIFNNLLNIIEYIHSFNYIHNDIKSINILIPDSKKIYNIILIDYGLACENNTKFKSFIGTRKFSSINSHKNISLTFIDDIEICCYNLLFWITKTLPWSNINKNQVLYKKIEFKNNYDEYILNLDINKTYKNILINLFSYIYNHNKYTKPNYKYLNKIIYEKI